MEACNTLQNAWTKCQTAMYSHDTPDPHQPLVGHTKQELGVEGQAKLQAELARPMAAAAPPKQLKLKLTDEAIEEVATQASRMQVCPAL
jgi:hypothetical protein